MKHQNNRGQKVRKQKFRAIEETEFRNEEL